MKIDNQTLITFAVELKEAVKEFVLCNTNRLWDFLRVYPERDQDYLLSRFDRYGVNVEYEKSGLRIVDRTLGQIGAYKIGFVNAKDTQIDNPIIRRARLRNLGLMRKTRIQMSVVDMPKTSDLIEAFRVVFAMQIFNTNINEATIYNKTLSLKRVMNAISENGLLDQYIQQLDEIFIGMNQEQRNKILELFDSKIPVDKFKGIRYVTIGTKPYLPVDAQSNITRFKYNVLNVRKTKDILDVWTTL